MKRWCYGMHVGWLLVCAFVLFQGAVVSAQDNDGADPPRPTLDDDGVPVVRFNFKGQSWDQVLDYFSRVTGKPIVRDAKVPEGTVDYLNPTPYRLPKAIETLNLLLQTRGVMLRDEDGRLVLEEMETIRDENIPTFVEELPEGLTGDQVVTFMVPLSNATAASIAEQLKDMVAPYGVLTALPEQNSLLVVETAANVRRIQAIIEQLDREDSENLIEQIGLKHAEAEQLLPVLELLMSERVVEMVTRGKSQVRVEKDQLPAGFRISADPRSNSIIARGTIRRIERLRSAVSMLDQPDMSSGIRMRTIPLERLTPDDAENRLKKLFEGLAQDKRPRFVKLDEVNRITVVGEPSLVDQAVLFLADLEGTTGEAPDSGSSSIAMLKLTYLTPQNAVTAIGQLLTPRQSAVVKVVPVNELQGVLVSGPPRDLDDVKEVVALIDVPPDSTREIRYQRIEAIQPGEVLERAKRIHAVEARDRVELMVDVEFNEENRRLVLTGTTQGLDLFNKALKQAADSIDPQLDIRRITLEKIRPSVAEKRLKEIAPAMLQPKDGSVFIPPRFEGIDELDTLVVIATTEQMPTLEEIVKEIDVPEDTSRQVRYLRIEAVDPAEALVRANRIHDVQIEEKPDLKVVVEFDAATRRLVLTGTPVALDMFEKALEQAEASIQPEIIVRKVTLQFVEPNQAAITMREIAPPMLISQDGGTFVEPKFEAIDELDTLVVSATAEQMPVIEEIIQYIDVDDLIPEPPLRMLQLFSSDAAQVAKMLNRRYDARPSEQRRKEPVRLEIDDATNTLLVTAPDDVFNEIDEFVKDLNRKSQTEPQRETLIFPLKLARAMDLSVALGKLYPEPPMPRDSRNRPLPHLQKPREVFVSADAGTNTLIIEAPAERKASFEALVEQLDRVELPPQAEIRTWKILDMDGAKVVSTLEGLARKGVLSRAGTDGGMAVEVSIEFEPQSRTLIVAGDDYTFEQVEEILKSLDSSAHMPQTIMRVFQLQQARADSVAEMLQGILVARILEDVPGIDGEADAQRMLKITADRKTNIIILMAPAEMMPIAEELIQALDTTAAAVGDATVRVRPLTFAEAGLVAASLQQAIPNMTSEATGDPIDVKVIAAPGSNALLMIGLGEDIAEVDALIEPLDARPAMDSIDARTFSLQYADASRVAPLVERLLTDQQESDPRVMMERIRRSRGMIDLTPPVRVEAEVRTNSLIVSGPQQTVALAESLITQIDQPDEDAQRTYATFTPRRSDVNRLLANARTLLEATRPAGARSTLELLLESQSGAILVVGSEEETQRALKLLAQWDSEAPEVPQMDLQIINVEYAKAGVIANAVQGILRDRSRWPQELLAAARAGIAFTEPSVVVDGDANRVLVIAPAELMDLARKMITQLDRPVTEDALVMQVHAVPPGDAAEVARALQSVLKSQDALRPGEPPATVVAAPGANVVVVSATAERQADIARELEKFNITMGAAQVRTMFLKHSVAERIAPLVEKMLVQEEMYDPSDLPSWMRRSYLGGLQNDSEPQLRVVADPRLNAVVVAGPPAMLNAAEQIIGQLDVPSNNRTARSVRVLAIRNADASDVADSLDALFADAEDGEAAPVIRVNRSSNTLLVRATPEQFSEIQMVAGEIDDAAVQVAREIRTLPIDPNRGNAATIARMLEQMLDRPEDDRVKIVPLEELLEMTDPVPEKPKEPDDKVSWHGSGVNPHAAAIFAAVFAQVGDDDDAAEACDDLAEIVVAVDPETNSLVIVGAPRELQRFVELAEQAESELPAEGSIVRSIPLPKTVDVKSVANVVKQTIAMMIPAGGKRNDLARRAAIIPDEATHSLFIACQRSDLDLISQVVAAAARPAVAEKVVVRVYRFTDASAERAASGLNGLLSNARSPKFRELAITIDADGKTVESTFDPGTVRAFADVDTNALVVVAPSDAMPFVDRFVELTDQAGEGERTTLKLFKLQHARAADLRSTLGRIFTVRFRNLRRSGNASIIEPEFTVDERSNILLVTASVEELAEVETLLAKLDVEAASEQYPLEVIDLEVASPRAVASIIEQAVLGEDGSLGTNTLVVPDEQAGVLLVRAEESTLAEIRTVLKTIDRDSTNRYPVRAIELERADAGEVARAIERFYDDRARISSAGRGRRAESRRVAITGRPGGGTLLVACDDTDFEEITSLVKTFDSVDSDRNATYRIYPLAHARAGDVSEMVRQMVGELIFTDDFNTGRRRGDNQKRTTRGSVSVLADERLNALIVTGEGDSFKLVEDMVSALDAPTPENERRVVRYYRFPNIDTDILEDVLEEATETTNTSRGWWNRRSDGGKIEIINDYSSG